MSGTPRTVDWKWLQSPVWQAVLLGAVFSLPALRAGFSCDDFVHRLLLENKIPGYQNHWLSLYEFTSPRLMPKLIDAGYMPWFAADDLTVRFFRPLSSLLLAVENWCCGRQPVVPHLHSVAWFLLLVGVIARLYRRWFGSSLARWSAILYATAGLHAMPMAWVAARHAIVATALAALALLSHVRAREENIRHGTYLTLAALVAALCASEAALGIFPYFIAYELWRPDAGRRNQWLGAFVLVGSSYLLAYAGFGYGAHDSGMYLSPLGDPARFLTTGMQRLPLLLGQLAAAIPAEIPTAMPAATRTLRLLGIGLTLLVAVTAWFLRKRLEPAERRNVDWLAVASLASLLPALSTTPAGRLLPVALLGSAPIMATVMLRLWSERRRPLIWPLLGLVTLAHLFISPVWRIAHTVGLAEFGRAQQRIANQANLDQCGPNAAMYLLTGADPSLSLYARYALGYYHAETLRHRWQLLSNAPQDQRLTRVGPKLFELEVLGQRDANEFERLFSDRPIPVGFERHLSDLTVRVEAVQNGFFTRARLELAADPDAKDACLLVWRDRHLVSAQPPRIGASMIVRHDPGPMGL